MMLVEIDFQTCICEGIELRFVVQVVDKKKYLQKFGGQGQSR